MEEEEHASHVKTKSELEQTKSQLEGEVAGGEGGPGLSVHVCVCVLMGERMACVCVCTYGGENGQHVHKLTWT